MASWDIQVGGAPITEDQDFDAGATERSWNLLLTPFPYYDFAPGATEGSWTTNWALHDSPLPLIGWSAGAAAPTRGQVSWVEMEIPFAQTRGRISWSELEVPFVHTRGRVAWTEFELPLAPARGRVSFVEFASPLVATRGRVSVSEFEVPSVVVLNKHIMMSISLQIGM